MQLNERIYEDLGACIESGSVPCKLTLSALADHYGVSPAPIRAAVSRLVAEGRLRRHENGRLGVDPDADTTTTVRGLSNGAAVGEARDVEHAVRQDVIRRSLRGESGFLREESTAERHGIGRTALRPILARLAGAGLLEKSPRRGWHVHAFAPADLDDFLDIRELLELRALVLARPLLESAPLQEFLDQNRLAEGGLGPLDNRLHGFWIERSNNKYLRAFFSRDAAYFRSLFDFATPEAHQVTEMAAQHCEILEALLGRRWAAAAKSLSVHIRAQRSIVLSLVDQVRGQADAP